MGKGQLALGTGLVVGALVCYLFQRQSNKRKRAAARSKVNVRGDEASFRSIRNNDANVLTHEQATFLKSMLTSQNLEMVNCALVTIGNMSAFTDNLAVFRECNCLQAVVAFISSQTLKNESIHSTESLKLLDNALFCLNNLCLNEENQLIMQDVIPALMQLIENSTTLLTTKQNCMMALTNFSILPTCNQIFHTFLPSLVDQVFVEEGVQANSYRLSVLKILINLSTSEKTAKMILECKVPSYLSFSPITHPLFYREDVFLRWLTLMSHLSTALKDTSIIHKEKLPVFPDCKVHFKSLFFDKHFCAAMKRDLTKFLDQNIRRNDKKELCDIAAYIQANLFKIDAMENN